jgi:hypothetical protein
MLKMTPAQLFAPFMNGGEVSRLSGPAPEPFGVAETFRIVAEHGPLEFFVVWWNPFSRGDNRGTHFLHVLNYHIQGEGLFLDTDDGIWLVQPPSPAAEESLAAAKAERERDPQAALEYETAVFESASLMAHEMLVPPSS